MQQNNTHRLNKAITTKWHNNGGGGGGGGGQRPLAGYSNFTLCAKHKHKPHLLPHYRGVGQEYWQSLSYLPSAARARSDKIKTNE